MASLDPRRRLAAVVTLALAAPFAALATDRSVAGPPGVERFTGTARGQDGRVLYVEEHQVRRAGDQVLDAMTTYRDPAGAVMAVLRSDYAGDPWAPSYRFEDRRTGRVEAVETGPDGATLEAGGKRVTLPRPRPGRPPLVGGQGLDRLVRAHLDALRGGERLTVAFAIPSRQDAFEFRVRALPPEVTGGVVRVRVEVASWLLRLLAPHMDCDYDPATRRLLRYRGPSNLEGEGGAHPDVEITYAYSGGPHEEVALASP
jgi:hypothetical protein